MSGERLSFFVWKRFLLPIPKVAVLFAIVDCNLYPIWWFTTFRLGKRGALGKENFDCDGEVVTRSKFT